ncbi:MAG: hypothetical protein SXA11_20545 [Cyanobacteriota bacterium]|nr:hypothetical protein [Cyanobacteriota bacterium]
MLKLWAASTRNRRTGVSPVTRRTGVSPVTRRTGVSPVLVLFHPVGAIAFLITVEWALEVQEPERQLFLAIFL